MTISKILKIATREKKALTKSHNFAISFYIEAFYTKTEPKMILSHIRNQFRVQMMFNPRK
jgi:hypothetical protein